MDIITNIIDKRPSICKYGKAQIYVCTFQEIFEFSNILHLPDMQGDLNQNKVEEMINSYKNNHHFMASKALITITKISIADQVQYGLVDGQHRLEMIKQIYQKDEVIDDILIAIINVESEEELKDLFLEINIDSSKCIYKNLNIFDKQIYEDLKRKINEDTNLIPLKKSDSRIDIYTTAQFVSHLIYNQIIEKLREKNLIENNASNILDFLKLKEREFFNLYKYDSKKLDKLKFKTEEIKQINAKSCMFIKNNNFLDWILDTDLEPDHDLNTRPPITLKLKKAVWTNIYDKDKSHLCPIVGCSSIMIEKEHETWHCGHVISHKNNGPTDKSNLRPICPHCNRKMNYRNWNDWEKEHITKLINNTYFNESQKISCCNEKCENKITKKTYKVTKYEDNTAKPWCKECYNILNGIKEEEINKEIIIDTDSDENTMDYKIKKIIKPKNKKKKMVKNTTSQKNINI
jgi:hypothetical protein